MVPGNQIASKVGAAAAAANLAVVSIWLLGTYVTVPETVAAAITGLFVFGAGWLAKAEPQLQLPEDE